jgi:enamine deaminase RidA (YjgF/YER057c/UK114 family)
MMNTQATDPLSPTAKPLAKYAPYRRAGDFIFLSGVIAVEPASGLIVKGFADIPQEAALIIGQTGEFSSDIKQGPILAQSWFVLNKIKTTMESLGGDMADVFKLVQYFKNLDHFALYSSVRNRFFESQSPASTVVEVSEMLPTHEILIEVEATAFLPLQKA